MYLWHLAIADRSAGEVVGSPGRVMRPSTGSGKLGTPWVRMHRANASGPEAVGVEGVWLRVVVLALVVLVVVVLAVVLAV